jgi:hypothetical protein
VPVGTCTVVVVELWDVVVVVVAWVLVVVVVAWAVVVGTLEVVEVLSPWPFVGGSVVDESHGECDGHHDEVARPSLPTRQ